MSEQTKIEKEVALENVITSAVQIPGVEVNRNKFLSEKRAEAVYNALVKQGVNPSQLEKVAMGGVDPMFFDKAYLSRVVVLESK